MKRIEDKQKIADFYLESLSRTKTAELFKISEIAVSKIFKEMYGLSITKYLKQANRISDIDKIYSHSKNYKLKNIDKTRIVKSKEQSMSRVSDRTLKIANDYLVSKNLKITAEKFGAQLASVSNAFQSVYGTSLRNFLTETSSNESLKHKAIAEYLVTHSYEETAEMFDMFDSSHKPIGSTMNRIFKRHYGMSKSEFIKNYHIAHKNEILKAYLSKEIDNLISDKSRPFTRTECAKIINGVKFDDGSSLKEKMTLAKAEYYYFLCKFFSSKQSRKICGYHSPSTPIKNYRTLFGENFNERAEHLKRSDLFKNLYEFLEFLEAEDTLQNLEKELLKICTMHSRISKKQFEELSQLARNHLLELSDYFLTANKNLVFGEANSAIRIWRTKRYG